MTTSPLETLILIPTVRPKKIPKLVAQIAGATPQPHSIVIVVEHRDLAPAMTAQRKSPIDFELLVNDRKGHQGAYNAALVEFSGLEGWRYWFHGADDLRFEEGWLGPLLELAEADPDAGVIGTNDLSGSRSNLEGRHATHYLVRRSYSEGAPAVPDVDPPAAYFEGYVHNFVETELIDVAIERGAFRSCLESIVEHLHPAWGKAEPDEVYDLASSAWNDDRALYRARREARGAA